MNLPQRLRFWIAYWKWWNEPFPPLDPKQRRTLPKGPLRRQTLRLMNERHRAREPKWESFS
jgi:hypothetical protein